MTADCQPGARPVAGGYLAVCGCGWSAATAIPGGAEARTTAMVDARVSEAQGHG